jgi:hypothetical protein
MEITMKQILILAAAAIMALGSTAAFAGGHGCGGHGWDGHDDGYGIGSVETQISAETAKANVQAYIDANLKGYSIAEVTSHETRRGNVYKVNATDVGGNSFIFFVGQKGRVRGPIPENEFNARFDRQPPVQ